MPPVRTFFDALFVRPHPVSAAALHAESCLRIQPWVGILAAYLCAVLAHRLSGRLAGHLMRLRSLTPRFRRPTPERQRTLQSLLSSVISFLAFGLATFIAASYFIRVDTLVWVIGLFSAAFGLAAGPAIRDVLTGVGFIFADTFAVGEKVEIAGIDGVIESITLRGTLLRAPSGELYVIPNGEIRTVRNFSRGRFSPLTVTLTVPTAELPRALKVLQDLGQEAVTDLPNLLDPWQVIAESGIFGRNTEQTLLARARFGKAAEMRPRLLSLVHERLASEGILPAH